MSSLNIGGPSGKVNGENCCPPALPTACSGPVSANTQSALLRRQEEGVNDFARIQGRTVWRDSRPTVGG